MRTRHLFLCFAALSILAISACSVHTEKSASGDNEKNVDIETPVGDLHVGKDVDARDAGLAVYPGAKLKDKKGDDDDSHSANLSIMTSLFGLKVVAAEYVSDDAPAAISAYYKDQMKKFGKILECHTDKVGKNVDVNEKDDHHSGPVTCESPNTGNVLELKVGTEDNQHVVSIEPRGKGTDFSLVFVRVRGKSGDI